MPIYVAVILGVIVAIAGTVLAYLYILPEKKRASLPKFFQVVADLFNFKYLVLEKILKALYIFSTLACIGIGFFMLFSVTYGWFDVSYMGFWGLLVIILGPVITRLIYEGSMLVILLVKNTIELNEKLIAQPGSEAERKAKEAAARQEEKERAERARQAYLDAQRVAQAQYAVRQPSPYTQPQAAPQAAPQVTPQAAPPVAPQVTPQVTPQVQEPAAPQVPSPDDTAE